MLEEGGGSSYMEDGKVAVVKAGEDVFKAVKRSIDLVGGLQIGAGDRVVVKPNLCNSKNPYGMVTTDFRIIETVVGLAKEKTGKVVVVESDNISDTAQNRAAKSGLLDRLEALGVDFVDLSQDGFEVHEVVGKKLKLPRTALDADYFINLPKIKTEGHVGVTLAIKNLFGVPQRRKKNRLHRQLGEILPYIAKVVGSDMVVVDGLVAMEGNGPLIGTPKELGIVVAGTSCVSVDSVCASIMGYNPKEISYLLRSHKMGLGEIDVDAVKVVGEDWRRLVSEFERPYSLKATLKSVKSIGKVYL
jgi:uncharacterized protein (DUF362 family)